MMMESLVKFPGPQNISGASQQNCIYIQEHVLFNH